MPPNAPAAPTAPRSRLSTALTLAAALWAVAAVVVGVLLFRRPSEPPPPPLPVLYAVSPFELTAEDGAAFRSDEQLRGKVWVANFIFTRCPTICPMFTRKMAEVQRGAAGLEQDVRLVSFTVDPAFDTPKVLAEYAEKHRARPGFWRFLTGDRQALKKTIVDEMKIHMSAEMPEDLMALAHGGHFVLLDRELNVRGFYDSEDADAVPRLLADLRRLVEERR